MVCPMSAHDTLIWNLTTGPTTRDDAEALVHTAIQETLHNLARVMENARYDEDAINFIDVYADAWPPRPTGRA